MFRYDPDEEEWVQEQKLTASDSDGGEQFGRSVAVSGDVVLIGAPLDDDNGAFSGSAYVFRYDSDEDEWVEEQKLTASDGSFLDLFGQCVALSGDVGIVGAFGDNGDRGSAYVFRYEPDTEEWVQEQKLTASDGEAGDEFALCVAISGDAALIGARFHGIFGQGSAYVFRYDGEEWVEEKLNASDGGLFTEFGTSVAISGDVALVGAPLDFDGSVYVFRYDQAEDEWEEEQNIIASDGAQSDHFGGSVALFNDLAIVGAAGDDDNGSGSGSAYQYRYDPEEEEWIEEQKLTAEDGAASDFLANSSVSVSHDVAFVAAQFHDDDGESSGAVYVFNLMPSSAECCELNSYSRVTLEPLEKDEAGKFGSSLAANAVLLVVGADRDDETERNAGAIYAWRRDIDGWGRTGKIVPDDVAEDDHFGASVALSGRVMIVGANDDDDGCPDDDSDWVGISYSAMEMRLT